ncbi:MAG: hypothetical protein GXP54_08410 [Deltaproteobacteria bacterium]|nr:hypothetical protein [Deltaproteobacteria bacterium]
MKRITQTTILSVLVVFMLFPGIARAEQACLDCHEDVVDQERFESSAHHGAKGASVSDACRSCHVGVEVGDDDDEHEAPEKVSCDRCHGDAARQVSSSAHVGGEKTNRCVGCHGSHYVEKASEKKNGDRLRFQKKTCGRCHEAEKTEYENSFHGQSKAEHVATCVDCHGSHRILSSSNPDSRTYHLNQAETCAACHTDPDAGFSPKKIQAVKDYFKSVHGLAISRSGLMVSATCVDCHGSHDISEICPECVGKVRARIPNICGKCHAKARKDYFASIHGAPLIAGNLDVPVCVDCHRSHQIQSHLDPGSSVYPTHISQLCLGCHQNENIINKYEFPPLRKETYLKSYHGAASKLGDKTVANCGSCHGFHLILPDDDPRSSINPANLAATCGKCHQTGEPDSSMVVGKIHATVAKERHWLAALVENIYVVLISATMVFFVFMIIIDLRKRLSK